MPEFPRDSSGNDKPEQAQTLFEQAQALNKHLSRTMATHTSILRKGEEGEDTRRPGGLHVTLAEDWRARCKQNGVKYWDVLTRMIAEREEKGDLPESKWWENFSVSQLNGEFNVLTKKQKETTRLSQR